MILACAAVLAAPLARAEETLQQKYLNIYLKINEAEQMERHGDYRGALADFKDCYDGLAKINKWAGDYGQLLRDLISAGVVRREEPRLRARFEPYERLTAIPMPDAADEKEQIE